MKFKFCGDLDCPDWILAEIATLSRMTSVKMKMLCLQVIKDLVDGTIDYDKVYKLTSDAKYDVGDIKATIAALSFVLSSAAKHSTDDQTLSNELQQLGLPKEHATALCKAYADNYSQLQAELRKQSLRISNLEELQWRVDYVISSSHLKVVNEPMAHLLMKIRKPSNNSSETVAFTMTDDKLRVLLHELKQAQRIMDGLT